MWRGGVGSLIREIADKRHPVCRVNSPSLFRGAVSAIMPKAELASKPYIVSQMTLCENN